MLILNILMLGSPAVVDRWYLAEMSASFFKHLHCNGKQAVLWFRGTVIRLSPKSSLCTKANELKKGIRKYGLKPHSIYKTHPSS